MKPFAFISNTTTSSVTSSTSQSLQAKKKVTGKRKINQCEDSNPTSSKNSKQKKTKHQTTCKDVCELSVVESRKQEPTVDTINTTLTVVQNLLQKLFLRKSLSNNVSQIASKSPAHRFIVDSCFNYQEIKSPKSIDDIISMAFVTFINKIPRSSMVAIAEHLNPHPNTLPSHHKKLASLIMEFLDEDSFHSKTDCLDHLSNTNPFFDDFFSSSPYNQSTSINPTETTPMCYELREESMEILLKEGLERFTMNHPVYVTRPFVMPTTNQAVSSDIYNLNYVKNFAPELWGKSQRNTNSPICKR